MSGHCATIHATRIVRRVLSKFTPTLDASPNPGWFPRHVLRMPGDVAEGIGLPSSARRKGVGVAWLALLPLVFGFVACSDTRQTGSDDPIDHVEASKIAVALGVLDESDSSLWAEDLSSELAATFDGQDFVLIHARDDDEEAPLVLERASEVGATCLLEGGVSRSGDQLRVAVDLTDVRSGKLLGTVGQVYDIPTLDMRSVTEEIATRVGLDQCARPTSTGN